MMISQWRKGIAGPGPEEEKDGKNANHGLQLMFVCYKRLALQCYLQSQPETFQF